ncbi:MAG: response regulator transcription factor [Lachnospiraceae bacterium]|nr:response regulator transcription factor [Lachnospiraceae bacterium]
MDNAGAGILVADDDEEIREVVSVLLSSEGYRVTGAKNAMEMLELLEGGNADAYSLIILDIMMPVIDGYEACRRIREISNVPILFLTAKSAETDMLKGFMSGGDDYLHKPFSYNELTIRVRALIRRYHSYRGSTAEVVPDGRKVVIGNLVIDNRALTVSRDKEQIELTNTEFGILWLLAGNRGKVFSVKEIYEEVWKELYLPTAANTIMVHIKNLMEKIRGEDGMTELIMNKWDKGYYIE